MNINEAEEILFRMAELFSCERETEDVWSMLRDEPRVVIRTPYLLVCTSERWARMSDVVGPLSPEKFLGICAGLSGRGSFTGQQSRTLAFDRLEYMERFYRLICPAKEAKGDWTDWSGVDKILLGSGLIGFTWTCGTDMWVAGPGLREALQGIIAGD